MKTKQTRTLAADVYDALELSVLANKGIGGACIRTWRDGKAIPCCVLGHAVAVLGGDVDVTTSQAQELIANTEVGEELAKTFADHTYNGMSLENPVAANDSLDYSDGDALGLITWKQWCKQAGVVRGN